MSCILCCACKYMGITKSLWFLSEYFQWHLFFIFYFFTGIGKQKKKNHAAFVYLWILFLNLCFVFKCCQGDLNSTPLACIVFAELQKKVYTSILVMTCQQGLKTEKKKTHKFLPCKIVQCVVVFFFQNRKHLFVQGFRNQFCKLNPSLVDRRR